MQAEAEQRDEVVNTPDGQLQTKVMYPSGEPGVVAVITHPYGPLGGDMNNPVCLNVARGCSQAGMVAVRMNFRGVGSSTGSGTWRATGEQDDVRSVVRHYMKSAVFKTRPKVLLIGYSFGSVVSGSLLSELQGDLAGYVAVAYPFSVVWFLTCLRTAEMQRPLVESPAPKLFIHGTRDNFSSAATAEGHVSQMGSTAKLQLMEDADHFFASGARIREIVKHVLDFAGSCGVVGKL